MKLAINNSVDKTMWDSTVTSFGGSIFHMSIWAEYITARQPLAVPQFFTLLKEDGSVAGCALGFKESSRIRIMKPFTKNLWFDSTPVVKPDKSEHLDDFFNNICSHAQQTGYVRVTIGSFASETREKNLKSLGFDLAKRLEFIVQLDRSEDELWKALSARRRRSVRSASKNNVTLEHMKGGDALKILHDLQNESAKRIKKRGGPDLMTGNSMNYDPLDVLQKAGVAQVMVARAHGKVESAALILHSNRQAYYMQAGHSPEGLENHAPSLLIWECFHHYKNKGASVFNLGGCSADALNSDSPEYGLYVFKKEFGGKTVECTSGQKVLRKNHLRIANHLRNLFRH